ncbi:hypothetical protein C9374_010166 [Naegleria lovaniensis]|uniref:Uncharacterized protein n=1 Tax=Naegleria lovaniensis TaxID=51637 RepID=A0AA88GGG5_NAELO|nr:uncharacterized protein C9374_010166 [Naegleria lovaniensis]KAG2375162.1 hypothetical protein C9374_010166 [Naegleria lovaniensis]
MSFHNKPPLVLSEAFSSPLRKVTFSAEPSRSSIDSSSSRNGVNSQHSNSAAATPYFDASLFKEEHYSQQQQHYHHSHARIETFKKYWKKFSSSTFGNRRLKMYIYSCLKFLTITYVQANDLFGKSDTLVLTEGEQQLQLVFKIVSYTFMAILMLLFTERYIRELTAVARKKPLTIWINWMESIVYLMFFIYSIATSVIHVVYIVREYDTEVEERILHPEIFAKKSFTLEEHLAVEILEVFVHIYIIVDKGTHFIHASHSVSYYLAKAQHIPKHHHPGHHPNDYFYVNDASKHNPNHALQDPNILMLDESDAIGSFEDKDKEHAQHDEESDDDYDDFIGKTYQAARGKTRRRNTTLGAVYTQPTSLFVTNHDDGKKVPLQAFDQL